MKSLVILTVGVTAAVVLGAVAAQVSAAVIAGGSQSLIVGRPANNGVIEVEAEALGTKGKVQVTVQRNMEPKEKAEKIAKALQDKGVLVGIPLGSDTEIQAPGVDGKIRVVMDSSNEKSRILSDASAPAISLVAEIGFGGMISGRDFDGGISFFEASFGFDGLLADAVFQADELSALTVGILLGSLYDELAVDLPAELLPALGLDLDRGLITFNFPPDQANYFAQNDTTDVTVVTSLALSRVAEVPAASSLLTWAGLFGVLGYLAPWRRSRPGGKTREHSDRDTGGAVSSEK